MTKKEATEEPWADEGSEASTLRFSHSELASCGYGTLRLPLVVLAELRRRADRLERYLSERTSLKQSASVRLPSPPHEQHGVAPWQVVARLLEQRSRYEERKRKSRRSRASRNRSRRKTAQHSH